MDTKQLNVHNQTLPDIDPLSPNPRFSSVGVVSQLSTLSKMKPWVLQKKLAEIQHSSDVRTELG